jgi:hypothetical protein
LATEIVYHTTFSPLGKASSQTGRQFSRQAYPPEDNGAAITEAHSDVVQFGTGIPA